MRNRKDRSGRAVGALKVVLAYAIFAALWILLSDTLVDALVRDREMIVDISIAKGWIFVAVTSLLLYSLTSRLVRQVQDYDERERAAEASHRRTHAQLQLLIDHTPAALAMFDRDLRYLAVSRRWIDDFGLAEHDIIGRSHYDVFPEIPQHWKAAHLGALAGKVTRSDEDRFERADGRVQWLRWEVRPWNTEDGAIGGVVIFAEDVSQQKQTEAALRANAERLRKLSRAVEQSPASIVITDRDGRIEYVNPRFEEVTGYKVAEVIGRNPRLLKSGLTPPQVYQELWITVAAGGEWRGELCNRRKSGELFWEQAAISGLQGDDGAVTHYIAVKDEITARKQAELRLRLEHAVTACIAAAGDASSALQEVIRAVCETEGWERGTFWRADAAAGVLRFGEYWHAPDSGLESYAQGSREMVFSRGNGIVGRVWDSGAPIWVADASADPRMVQRALVLRTGLRGFFGFPVVAADKVLGVLAFLSREVREPDARLLAAVRVIGIQLGQFLQRKEAETALRESEQRFATIFHASPVGIVISRLLDGVIFEANAAALGLFGYARDDAIGRTTLEVGVYTGLEQRRQMIEALMAQGQVDAFEVGFRQRSGSVGTLAISARPIVIAAEECLIAMMLDVTERKRLEEVHMHAQKLESLGTLAGGIAHDFNNILGAIRGNAELAATDLASGHPAQASVAEIARAGARASELVRRILAFGRPQPPQRAPANLAEVVREVLQLLRSTLPARIEFKTRFVPDVPTVHVDSAQVHEAVVNLTTNAAYAIADGGGAIEYALDALALDEGDARQLNLPAGRYVRLSVRDDGCGMDEATVERVFDAFYTTKPAGKGTGLGLSMVYGIMQSHAGAVSVESAPGQGSAFHLYFPLAAHVDAAAAAAVAQAVPRSTGRRVLFVDDEEALVILAKRMLERLGHGVDGFSDAAAALAHFRSRPADFDVVVTDLSMPHMSGIELARGLRAARPDIPVLITSGYFRAEDEAEAHAAGISDLLPKPATMEDLAQAIDRMIAGV